MSESSWPTASGGGVVGQTWEQMAVNFFGDGLHGSPTSAPLVYADSTGRQVKLVADRVVTVRGFAWTSGPSILTKSVAANTTAGTTRIDRVVLGLSRSGAWPVTAYVKTGTAVSSNPQPPALQQDPTSGGTGTFEISVARIGPLAAGFTTVAATDVTPEAWYLGPPTLTCTSTTRPPPTLGLRIYESDTHKEWIGNGTAFVSSLEDTGWQPVPAASNWQVGTAYIRRYNGEVTLDASFKRTGGNVAAGTAVSMGTVPVGYRPTVQLRFLGYLDGANLVLGTIETNGGIVARFYPSDILTGRYVTLNGKSWPV